MSPARAEAPVPPGLAAGDVAERGRFAPLLHAGLALRALLVVLGAAPLLVAHVAPLQDWPSHLARVGILASLLGGDPAWAQYYDATTFLLPNVALDVGVLALVRLGLSVETAGTIFLVFSYALFVSGFWMLARACSAASAEKLPLGILLFYSWALFWGFINYTVGLGLLFWALALYASARASIGRKAGFAAVAAGLVFECHAVAAVLLVLLLACHDAAGVLAAGRPRLRDALWDALRHAPRHVSGFAGSASAAGVFLVLYALSPAATDNKAEVVYIGSGSVLGVLKWKAGVFAKAFLGGSVASDLVLAACAVAALCSAPFLRRVRMPLWAVLAVGALCAVTLAAPQQLGAGSHLDNRLAAMPFLIAAAAARLEWRRAAIQRVALAVLVVGVAARSAALTVEWSRAGAVIAALDAHFATLPRGGILLVGHGKAMRDIGWSEFWSPPIGNVAARAARHGVFVPTVFALPSQQPLVLKRRFHPWDTPAVVSDPLELAEALARARPLCRGELTAAPPPRVEMLILFPGPFLGGGATSGETKVSPQPPMRPLLDRFGTMDMCDASNPG